MTVLPLYGETPDRLLLIIFDKLAIICTTLVGHHTHADVTDIYDTAVNPEPDDLYDEAMPQPVSILLC